VPSTTVPFLISKSYDMVLEPRGESGRLQPVSRPGFFARQFS
jgi:hypothetical protein